MNPNPNKMCSGEDNDSSFGSATSTPEGSEGVLPFPTHEAPDTDIESERPDRAGQIGEGSYEGTDGYAKSIVSYLRTAEVDKDAKAAAPDSPREARELLEAESKGASRSKAPGK